jgi:hypothetical protein
MLKKESTVRPTSTLAVTFFLSCKGGQEETNLAMGSEISPSRSLSRSSGLG